MVEGLIPAIPEEMFFCPTKDLEIEEIILKKNLVQNYVRKMIAAMWFQKLKLSITKTPFIKTTIAWNQLENTNLYILAV